MRERTCRATETPLLSRVFLARPVLSYPHITCTCYLQAPATQVKVFSNLFCLFVNPTTNLSFVLHSYDLRFGGFISRSEKSTVLFLRRHFKVKRILLCVYKRHYTTGFSAFFPFSRSRRAHYALNFLSFASKDHFHFFEITILYANFVQFYFFT